MTKKIRKGLFSFFFHFWMWHGVFTRIIINQCTKTNTHKITKIKILETWKKLVICFFYWITRNVHLLIKHKAKCKYVMTKWYLLDYPLPGWSFFDMSRAVSPFSIIISLNPSWWSHFLELTANVAILIGEGK